MIPYTAILYLEYFLANLVFFARPELPVKEKSRFQNFLLVWDFFIFILANNIFWNYCDWEEVKEG